MIIWSDHVGLCVVESIRNARAGFCTGAEHLHFRTCTGLVHESNRLPKAMDFYCNHPIQLHLSMCLYFALNRIYVKILWPL